MKKKLSLANKYRPKEFSDLIGQESIKTILVNQVKANNIKHAYLFTGPAGIGKTTSCRIIAKMMNNGETNPIELDCASNNSVDDVRRIIDQCRTRPLKGKYKIFLLDECFSEDTLVMTINGNKKIKDIKENDYVATINGFNKVNKIFKKSVPNEHLVNIKLDNNEEIHTTKDHLFFTEEGWVAAKDLIKGDELYVYQNISQLKNINTVNMDNESLISYCINKSNNDETFYNIQSKPRLQKRNINDRGGWQRFQLEKTIITEYKELDNLIKVHIKDINFYNQDNIEQFKWSGKDNTELYDLSVQDNYSYFANNVLVHNCHMLSLAAWNAMLKILEEPPEYIIFLLATTDPQKIPATILSRTQRFNFTRLSVKEITNRLIYIIDKENKEYFETIDLDPLEFQKRQNMKINNIPYITYEKSAIEYIARLAKGGMRDSITNLEKCLDFNTNLTLQNVLKITSSGLTESSMLELLKYTLNKQCKEALLHYNNIYMSGLDPSLFLKLYTEFLENCVKFLITQDANIVTLSDVTINWLKDKISFLDEIRYQLLEVLNIKNNFAAEDLKILIESWIMQICK